MTTIEIDTSVRDRLAEVARAAGMPMAALLRVVTSELEDRMRWTLIEAACQRLRDERPGEWAEYMAELDAWDSASGDPGNAAGEWPEFNS